MEACGNEIKAGVSVDYEKQVIREISVNGDEIRSFRFDLVPKD